MNFKSPASDTLSHPHQCCPLGPYRIPHNPGRSCHHWVGSCLRSLGLGLSKSHDIVVQLCRETFNGPKSLQSAANSCVNRGDTASSEFEMLNWSCFGKFGLGLQMTSGVARELFGVSGEALTHCILASGGEWIIRYVRRCWVAKVSGKTSGSRQFGFEGLWRETKSNGRQKSANRIASLYCCTAFHEVLWLHGPDRRACCQNYVSAQTRWCLRLQVIEGGRGC